MASGSFHIPRRLSPEEVDALFAAQRSGDPVGVKIHMLLALGACFFAGWSTSFVEWAALPVLICFLVRMTGRHAILEPLAHDRVLRLLLVWGAWMGVSVLWSAGMHDPVTGAWPWLAEAKSLRFLAMAVILWPVMDRRSWLANTMYSPGLVSTSGQLRVVLSLGVYHPDSRTRFSKPWRPILR